MVGRRLTPAWPRLDPVWDYIRTDPGFQELAGKRNRDYAQVFRLA